MHLFFQPVQDYLFPCFPEIMCSVISSIYKTADAQIWKSHVNKSPFSIWQEKTPKFQKNLSV